MPEPIEKNNSPTAKLKREPKKPWDPELAKAVVLAQHKSLDKDKDRLYRFVRFIIARAVWIGLILWGGPKVLKTIEYVFWVSSGRL